MQLHCGISAKRASVQARRTHRALYFDSENHRNVAKRKKLSVRNARSAHLLRRLPFSTTLSVHTHTLERYVPVCISHRSVGELGFLFVCMNACRAGKHYLCVCVCVVNKIYVYILKIDRLFPVQTKRLRWEINELKWPKMTTARTHELFHGMNLKR